MPSIDKDRPGMLSDICNFIFFMISIYAVDSINVFIIIIIVKLFIYLRPLNSVCKLGFVWQVKKFM